MSNTRDFLLIIYIALRWLLNLLMYTIIMGTYIQVILVLFCSIIGIPLAIYVLPKHAHIEEFLQKYFTLDITKFLIFKIALEAEINKSS